jgi:hypothetical protein
MAKEQHIKGHHVHYMQGNMGKIAQGTMVSACTKISINLSLMYANYTMKSTNKNCQDHS